MELSFAPLEGITTHTYRTLHARMFPGVTKYYAPFIAPDANGFFKHTKMRDLMPENNSSLTLIPQILVNRAEPFIIAARELKSFGYEEINLNAGCPSGTVVSKRKGSGMLISPAELDAVLYELFDKCDMKISVKTRLGMESAEEFAAIMEVYSKYPISELIVHARTRSGMYKSAVDIPAFAAAFDGYKGKMCYNGNVKDIASMQKLIETIPSLNAVMIGRAAVVNPALFRQLCGGDAMQREEMRAFHDELLENLLALGIDPVHCMARLKEIWSYMIKLFPDSAKAHKAINKSRSLPDYRAAVAALFSSAEFDGDFDFSL